MAISGLPSLVEPLGRCAHQSFGLPKKSTDSLKYLCASYVDIDYYHFNAGFGTFGVLIRRRWASLSATANSIEMPEGCFSTKVKPCSNAISRKELMYLRYTVSRSSSFLHLLDKHFQC